MTSQIVTASTVLQQAQMAGVRQVRFLYCDNGGIIRGKAAGLHSLADRLHGGIGLTAACQALNPLDQLQIVEGMTLTGEVRLVPDLRTFRVLPYAPKTAGLLCDMQTVDGEPWDACPRGFLRRQIELARGNLGIAVVAAFEPEWSLARRGPDGSFTAIDDSSCYSSIGMMTAATVIDEIIGALEAQNMRVEQYHPEYAHAQQEITIAATNALEAADNLVQYRETVRGVAFNNGYFASFAPKPFAEQLGNGCHLHFSGWAGDRGDVNVFYDPDDRYCLSEMAYHFMGGILKHLPALTALTCASVNSYRRLKPHSWAGVYACYGLDNREVAMRMVSPLRGRERASVNLELRTVDNTCNPYLALGAVIAAGLDGVKNELHPGDRLLVQSDPHNLTMSEREERGIRRLPVNFGEALDELESDEVITKALGPVLTKSYLAVKRSECANYASRDSSYELIQHFFRY